MIDEDAVMEREYNGKRIVVGFNCLCVCLWNEGKTIWEPVKGASVPPISGEFAMIHSLE